MNPTKYHMFCLADRMLFETPARLPDEDDRFPEARASAPADWHRRERGLWVVLVPDGANLPVQGWKIHVSVTQAAAPAAIRTVWEYCVAHGVAFKFLRSPAAQAATNSKVSGRGVSGKVVAIYPESDEALATVLTGLAPRLAGLPGSYILGDLRYEQGPLYVRYGAFGERYCAGKSGEPAFAIFAENGELVPDERGAVFAVPTWVSVPPILQPSIQAMELATVADFPYDIVEPLQFSNAGGIYAGVERATGTKVVLREARPHAGLDAVGDDAVTRLHRAREAMTKLAGLACVPRLIDHRRVWEHEFLVEEYIEGRPLLDLILERYPYVHPDPEPAAVAAYQTWVDEVTARLAEALDEIHQRGVWYGDLHPANVIVRPDASVALIDFELAAELPGATTRGLRADGFAPPPDVTGFAADTYALECVRLYARLPLTQVLSRDRRKAVTLLRAAESLFPSAPAAAGGSDPVDRWPALMGQPSASEPDEAAAMFAELPASWPAVRDSLVAGILAAATPERDDRLFPGDPTQFATGGIAIRDGAAGVLLALRQVGVDDLSEHVDWLIRASHKPQRTPRAGLLSGRHGVAVVLDTFGCHDDAHRILALAREHDEWLPAAGLVCGRAGVVLALLHFGVRGDAALLREAVRLGDDLVALVAGADKPGGIEQPATAGLLRGYTGIAFALLRLYDATTEERYLVAAERALRHDLDRCQTLPDGSIHLLDGTRYLPYLDTGSAGIAMVLREFLRYRPDSDLGDAVDGLRRACHARVVFQPGLSQGRAGLMMALTVLGHEDDRPVVLRHARDLSWHAISFQGGLAFPGAWLQRLSTDLGTGSAGILLALDTVFGTDRPVLPFLAGRGVEAPALTTVDGR